MTTRTNKLTNLVAATLVSAASVTVSADMTGSITSLSHGYEGVVLAEKRVDEGRCGEGKCGASSTSVKTEEGKCGEGKCGGDGAVKADEGKCGEGKCGESASKDEEGKCGEGKCGAA